VGGPFIAETCLGPIHDGGKASNRQRRRDAPVTDNPTRPLGSTEAARQAMSHNLPTATQDFAAQAQAAATEGRWQAAAEFYALGMDQRNAELALVNRVQEGLSAKLDMPDIYTLVGDQLRDTFNAQVVMISQYDPQTNTICHRYAIERGQHLHVPGWSPLDSSRAEIVRTRKPFMINLNTIRQVVDAGKMWVVPGTELPKTWLGVPMLVGNEVRGIVSLQNLDKENAFTKSDIDLLGTLAASLSLSLENARLFSETERFLKLLEREMAIARDTQQGILPMRLPRHTGYDFASLITPARAVGGDFYDLIRLDRDRLCLSIGDVADKGLPAALYMAITFGLLRAEAGRSNEPRELLASVNRYLLKMNATGTFVTLVYGILDCRTGALRYARAGHLPPIVLSANGEVIRVGRTIGQPLGVFDDIQLDIQEVTIPLGGLVLLHSDGLNEAMDARGREFGVERITQELCAHRHDRAKTICRKLWKVIEGYCHDRPHQDDFTMVLVKRLASNSAGA
jgi:serine phosphatase RsbU (regulator of sigma subunit)